MKKYLGFLGAAGTYMGYNMDAFFAQMSRAEQENRNKQSGIELQGDMYGVPSKSIPFEYDMLDYKNGYYFASNTDLNYVFDKSGKLLFSGANFDYLEKGFFLVNQPDNKYGAIYKDGVKLTDDLFRVQMGSKFESDFCVLGYKEFDSSCAINTKGEVVLTHNGFSSGIYIKNNTASIHRKYYNLFTGELIIEGYYSSTLKTDEFLFFELKSGQVCKLNTITCETELFGKEPERGVGKSTSMANFDTSKAIIIDDISDSKHKPEQKHIIAKQGRNELCACGSGKKHKNCCLKS